MWCVCLRITLAVVSFIVRWCAGVGPTWQSVGGAGVQGRVLVGWGVQGVRYLPCLNSPALSRVVCGVWMC